MSTKADLHQLANDLRRYLEWQRESGVAGIVPASPEACEVWNKLEKERQQVRMERLREALTEEVLRTTPSRSNAEPPSSPPSEEVPFRPPPGEFSKIQNKPVEEVLPATTSGSNALWKTIGVRPKKTFAEPSPAPRPSDQKTSALAPETPQRSRPTADPGAMSAQDKLAFLRNYMGDCRRCALCASRVNITFGVGNPEARLMFIGEAPGPHDDAAGVPFVGDSGQLLDRMIKAMGLSREQVYLTNVVKCRAPVDRAPSTQEVGECSPFLMKQLSVVKPEVIVTLGPFAAQSLLKTQETMDGLRGKWQTFQDIPVMPTYHPAYLLGQDSDPQPRRAVWSDLQLVMKRLGLS